MFASIYHTTGSVMGNPVIPSIPIHSLRFTKVRAVSEGSTLVMRAINTNQAMTALTASWDIMGYRKP